MIWYRFFFEIEKQVKKHNTEVKGLEIINDLLGKHLRRVSNQALSKQIENLKVVKSESSDEEEKQNFVNDFEHYDPPKPDPNPIPSKFDSSIRKKLKNPEMYVKRFHVKVNNYAKLKEDPKKKNKNKLMTLFPFYGTPN